MLIELEPGFDVADVRGHLANLGLWTDPFTARDGRVVLRVAPHSSQVDPAAVRSVVGVRDVLVQAVRWPRVRGAAGSPVRVGPARLGAGLPPVLAAGPCGADSKELVEAAAGMVAEAGGALLRGGAVKARTSPYSFQGHGSIALRWLREAADQHGLGLVTEVLSEDDVPAVAEVADALQIGTRNMSNFALLRRAGASGRPVLLKRGRAATIDEWLLAGEYLLDAGASGVLFCERGVRGFDPSARNLLDLGAAALLVHVHGLAVVVDPSHATGRRDLVLPLSRAALAAGVAGLLVETHPDARQARSDGPQALAAGELSALGHEVRRFGGVRPEPSPRALPHLEEGVA